jgi:hypothetical protein
MKKLTKRFNKKQQTKKRYINKKRRQTNKKRNGGMLKKAAFPVLSAVKTVGTEYAKDQAQRVLAGKQNVFKSFDANSPENRLNKRQYSYTDENNSENINPNIKIDLKPIIKQISTKNLSNNNDIEL